jgi:hypothetical protein
VLSIPDDASRVFVADDKQISSIDVKSGAVRLFADTAAADAMAFADGLVCRQ